MKKNKFCIGKERLVSLMDAVLAIIMTLLVLNLPSPDTPDFGGFWALRNSYFAYTLSFFWLGQLWMVMNRLFSGVHQHIDEGVMRLGLIILFACSLVPYLTMLASIDFYSSLVQSLFGLCTGSVNLLFLAMIHRIEKHSMEQIELVSYIDRQKRLLIRSFVIKMAGVALSWLWAPAGMISIIFSAVLAGFLNLVSSSTQKKEEDSCSCF